ncbi:MAG TPA: STAS domain-containing protein [Casimicrobiaceae bacterium]|jgi:anti-anti-sigma regulatory factor|nr:STAS domain-containing protein [Casimicrobiaceae bacterium]
MAFNLFPKPPIKGKPGEAKPPELKAHPDPGPRPVARPVSARELAASAKTRPGGTAQQGTNETGPLEREITVTGPHSMIEWSSAANKKKIQVSEANPGLCADLENAALHYANGQASQAREVLELGIISDDDTRNSPLAWEALFDLLQRANDRTAFDQLALRYVVAFESSAPAWEDRGGHVPPGARPVAGGYVGLTGKLTAGHAHQIAGMLASSLKQPQLRLDLGSITGADDAGAKLLADALAQLRKRHYPLALQHPEKIRRALEQSATQGRAAAEGYWHLLLELLQWQHDHDVFEDRAIEFAVAFEVSPPSWEPPPDTALAAAEAEESAARSAAPQNADQLYWQGTLTGSSDPQLGKFIVFREGRNSIPIDMTAIDRIDFVCAGALSNAIIRAESQRKGVQIIGASPIIHALLLLIGISPRHFVKKAQ